MNHALNQQRKLHGVENELDRGHSEDDIHETLKIKTEFEVFSIAKAKGAPVRAGTKWEEEEEKSTRYFLSLETKAM